MFIHIGPEETKTIRRIPRPLLFPAPARPKGHLVMGYNDQGHCPVLKHCACSIYKDRPQTCRSYDCRIFAATGIVPDQPEIADRVKSWLFTYKNEESRTEHVTLKEAGTFLRDHASLFPPALLPTQPAHLAALALRVHPVYAKHRSAAPPAIVEAILGAVQS